VHICCDACKSDNLHSFCLITVLQFQNHVLIRSDEKDLIRQALFSSGLLP
jgi:hypothetical protein